jgi:multidrug efflux pump subunit AcrA (membrane-fusion protein)
VKSSFVRPGQIAKVLVKEGEPVKANQVLVQQDDSVEQAQLEQVTADATDDTRIRAAKAQMDQKKVDLAKLEEALPKGATNEMEVEHARLDVTIAQLQMELEQFQSKQNARKQKELELQIKRMRIRSEIDGKVEEIPVKQGESADQLVKVIRVVRIDPLWVDVPVPMDQAARLQKGMQANQEQTLDVVFPAQDAPRTVLTPKGDIEHGARAKGKVIWIASVADSASMTRTVRVEVPNPTDRPAGEHVEVLLPQAQVPAQGATEPSSSVQQATKIPQ